MHGQRETSIPYKNMTSILKYLLLMRVWILLAFITKNVTTIPHETIKLGLDKCNSRTYCTTFGEYNKDEGRPSSCCTPCLCTPECSYTKQCCPDFIGFKLTSFKTHCSPVYYKKSAFEPALTNAEESEYQALNYLMVTTCRDGSDCVPYTPDDVNITMYDIQPVYSPRYNVNFMNRKCAQCNGIEQTIGWKMQMVGCRILPVELFVSNMELQTLILTQCALLAVAPDQIEHTRFICSSDIISTCNKTGRWDAFDQHIQEACDDPDGWYPAFDLQHVRINYKNIFCLLCNLPKMHHMFTIGCQNRMRGADFNVDQVLSLTSDLGSDMNMHHSQQQQRPALGDKCSEDEVYDWYHMKCRVLFCPPLTKAVSGSCDQLPDVWSDVHYEIHLLLIPTWYGVFYSPAYLHECPQVTKQTLRNITDGEFVAIQLTGDDVEVFVENNTMIVTSMSLRLYLTISNKTYLAWQKLIKALYLEDVSVTIQQTKFIVKPYSSTTHGIDNPMLAQESSIDTVSYRLQHMGREDVVFVKLENDKLYPYVTMSPSEYCKISPEVNLTYTMFVKDSCPLLYNTFLHKAKQDDSDISFVSRAILDLPGNITATRKLLFSGSYSNLKRHLEDNFNLKIQRPGIRSWEDSDLYSQDVVHITQIYGDLKGSALDKTQIFMELYFLVVFRDLYGYFIKNYVYNNGNIKDIPNIVREVVYIIRETSVFCQPPKTGVEALLTDTDLADVEIVVNHRIFKCHKSILVAVSPYFKAMFTGGMRESKQKRITLQDVDEVPFQKFLEFIYSGKIKLLDDDVSEMLRLAALFQVDCLQEHCEEILLEQLKSDNCLDLFRLSCMYNCEKLRKRAWPAILDGFCTVWKSEEFTELRADEIIAIIQEDCLVTMDEEHVCEAVLKWMEADLPNRKKHAYSIFSHVRIPHVSAEYLMNDLYKNPSLTEDSDCLKLLEEAQRFHMMPSRRLDCSGPRMRYRSDDDLEEVLLVITENDDQHGSFYANNWCLWAFSFLQNRWFTLAQIPQTEIPGDHFAVCSHGYDIYISGGENKPKALLKFESERNEWVVSLGQLKKARYKHSMVAIGNALYCVGGSSLNVSQIGQVMDYVEEYSIPGQRWRTVGELKHPVHSAAVAVVSEQILVFGGIGKTGQPMSCVQCFHTRKKEMTLLSDVPILSTKLLSTTIGETVYITTIKENRVLKLTQDFGLEDAGFVLPEDEPDLMHVSHYDGCFIVIHEIPDKCSTCSVNRIFKVNLQTSKSEYLTMKGIPKYMKACHRSCIDKRYLYHTYYQ